MSALDRRLTRRQAVRLYLAVALGAGLPLAAFAALTGAWPS